MNLRSGRSVTHSKASTQESGTRIATPLESIKELTDSETSTTSSPTSSKASLSMGDSAKDAAQAKTQFEQQWANRSKVRCDTKLIFVRENQYGAKLYNDFLSNFAVKIEERPTPFEPVVMANYQGDQYMGEDGTRYFISPLYEDMEPSGRVRHARAQTEPIFTKANVSGDRNAQGGGSSSPARQKAEQRDKGKNPEVSSKGPQTALMHMPVKRLACDHKYVALYRNGVEIVFKTMLKEGCVYPSSLTLHFYSQAGQEDPDILDDWGNFYHIVDDKVLDSYTWQGQPLSDIRVRQSHGFPKQAQAADTAREGETQFNASTPKTKPPWEEMVDNLNLHGHPREDKRAEGGGSGRGSTNPYLGREETHVGDSGEDFSRKESRPWGSGKDSRDKFDKPKGPKDDRGSEKDPRDRFDQPRGPKDDRRMRPTSLQKFSKRFDGSGDPHDHVAQYRQLVFAEGVTDIHTMVQGFGLTMEGRALSWFQTLKPSVLYDFETLIKRFIEAYSKIGIKHNTVTQILSFKQKDKETVRECVDRLRQYIVRCPESETPSQEHLISCFLEGLRDRQLYMHLFAKGHRDFDECCYDAQKFDDNCDFMTVNANQGSSKSGETNRNADPQAIADIVLRKLRQDSRTNQAYKSHQQAQLRAYNCGTCGGDHPTERCRVTNPLKWCDYCRKMTNHESSECYYRPGFNRGGNNAPTQNPVQKGNTNERARPVLGTQPTPPGTTAFRYVEDQGSSLEIVPTTPYYVEEPQHASQSGDSSYEQEFDGPDHMISMKAQTLMMMANGAFRKPGGYNNSGRQQSNSNFVRGPCFKCDGDHWVRDCPIDTDNQNQTKGGTNNWPRIIRYCADCGIEHVAKNCPVKMAEKTVQSYLFGNH